MPTTLTYTAGMAASPKGQHVGMNVLAFDYNSGAAKTGSISDHIVLGKIPNGALIISKNINMGISGAAATTYAMQLLVTEAGGTLSVFATLVNSITSNASTVQAYRDIVPFKVSFSDDRAVQHATLVLNCIVGVSGTVSTSLQGSVQYLTDGTTL